MGNVICVDFSQEFKNLIKEDIIKRGAPLVRRDLLELGYHPSFITALIRKIMKKNG